MARKSIKETSFFPDLETHLEIKKRKEKRDKKARKERRPTMSETIARW